MRFSLVLCAVALMFVTGCDELQLTDPVVTNTFLDLKVNGLDGTMELGGQPFTYSWKADERVFTACSLLSPSGLSGISLKGEDGPIGLNHPWYPKPGHRVIFVFMCTDKNGVEAQDEVTIIG